MLEKLTDEVREKTTVQAQAFSAATLARFDKEVANTPAEQKQSAVMACLSIVQQEQGHVSPEAEKGIANHWACPHGGA